MWTFIRAFFVIFFPEFLSLALNYRLKSAALGEERERWASTRREGRGTHWSLSGIRSRVVARMGKCLPGLCSPGMQSSWWGRDPPEQPRPLRGAAEAVLWCPATAWTHCTAPLAAQEGWSVWKYIKKSSRNFSKHSVSLSAVAGPSCFFGRAAVLLLRARVSSLPCPEPPHHSLCYWLLGPHAGAWPGRGSWE